MPLAVKIAFLLAGAVLTVIGFRVVPGGILVGSAQDVVAIKTHQHTTDSIIVTQHEELILIDTAHTRRLDRLERRQDLQLEIQRAQVRDRCGEIGFARAKRIGYPCDDAAAHLPTP